MKVTRIRKFRRKKIAEITIRVNGEESEQLSHAIDCDLKCSYPDLRKAGRKLLKELWRQSFSKTWGSNY